MGSLARRIAKLEARKQRAANSYARYPQYAGRPADYIRDILKQELTPDQLCVVEASQQPPYRVLVGSGHSTGKTNLSACFINYFYDCVSPSVGITTAPTHRDVCDLLWAEVRIQRRRAGLPCEFIGEKAPEMGFNEEHYAKGFTARKGESFQGRHREHMLFIFDEACGVDPTFWITAGTMFKPNGKHFWLCFFNPTDISSQAYQEWQKGGWNTVNISSINHPNIADELAGRPARIPGAVDVSQVRQWLLSWFDPIPAADADPSRDIEFPPGSGQWHRPGPLGESRVLGRWPTQAVNSVWSQGLWQMACNQKHVIAPEWPLAIGADIAYFGDDKSVFTVRHGLCIVHIEAHNGWDTHRSAMRIRELCHIYAKVHDPKRVPCFIDAGAMGPGVIDHHEGYNFIGVNAGQVADDQSCYKNKRSELWFTPTKAAKQGAVDFSHLPHHIRDELGRELMAPTYTVDSLGRLVVESKDETKKRIRKSPDMADSFNLSMIISSNQSERVIGSHG